MSNTLLLDADVLCYQFAFRNTESWAWSEDEEVTERVQADKAIMEVDDFIDSLRERLNGDQVYLVLSDRKENFRKQLDATYKAKRTPKPTLWKTIRDHVEFGDHRWPVRWKPRLEGDDVLGMMATHPTRGKKSIVVTIDKDMRTVPSRIHFFHRGSESGKAEVIHVDRFDAERFHLTQVLTGDPVDEYKGLPGIGAVKAEKLMDEHPDSNKDAWEAIVELYESRGSTEEHALLQARLAYILQYGDYKEGGIRLWKPTRIQT